MTAVTAPMRKRYAICASASYGATTYMIDSARSACDDDSARKAAAVAMGAPENVEFIPIGLIEGRASDGPAMSMPPDPEPAPQPAAAMCKSGSIEITLPNGARINVDAFVNEKALSRVLRAMKGVT